MKNDILKVLYDENQLKERVVELGKLIENDYKDKDLVVIGVLKGCMFFMADLVREIKLPLTIDFMVVSSYGASTKSSGVVRIVKDLERDIQGKDVLIVEDIIDTGLTLAYLMEVLNGRNPNSLRVVSLLDKPNRRKADVEVKYTGFQVPDEFVCGYGLDYNEIYRNLPFVCVLKPEIYENL